MTMRCYQASGGEGCPGRGCGVRRVPGGAPTWKEHTEGGKPVHGEGPDREAGGDLGT